jgi:hypothetical protein
MFIATAAITAMIAAVLGHPFPGGTVRAKHQQCQPESSRRRRHTWALKTVLTGADTVRAAAVSLLERTVAAVVSEYAPSSGRYRPFG